MKSFFIILNNNWLKFIIYFGFSPCCLTLSGYDMDGPELACPGPPQSNLFFPNRNICLVVQQGRYELEKRSVSGLS